MVGTQRKADARFMHKKWSTEKISCYVGDFKRTFFAYATNKQIRDNAASGGVATAVMIYLLEKGSVDGALVCRSIINEGRVRPEFFIAKSKDELLSAQGSKYMAVNFSRDALPIIRQFDGRLALTLLPCDTSALRRVMMNDNALEGKIALIISLFCGHNSRPELTDMVVNKLAPKGAQLTQFRHRKGHWRGVVSAAFDNGSQIEKPFSFFSDYQNLYFFCQKKCHYCHDHTGYESDLSVGDIWSLRMKENPIKHSAVITRTIIGDDFLGQALNAGILEANEEPIEEICEGQARTMPFHYNVSARAKAGKILGFKIKDSVNAQVRWNDFIVAWMALANEKLSRSHSGQQFISHIPRFILKALLYIMKGLESI